MRSGAQHSPTTLRAVDNVTASPGAKEGCFFTVGDTDRDASGVAESLRATFANHERHFGLHVGDFVYTHAVKHARDPELQGRPFRCFQDLPTMYLALGNHEYWTHKLQTVRHRWRRPGFAEPFLVS